MTDQPESGPREFPIQRERGAKAHPTSIPWAIADLAYSVYSVSHGDQSLKRLAERGGFYPSEMDELLPDWREQASALQRVEAERNRWKSEYENLCKFATNYEQHDEKTEARIAELSNGYFGRQAAKMCIELAAAEEELGDLKKIREKLFAECGEYAEKLAQAERECDEVERYRQQACSDLLKAKEERDTLRAENDRLRPVVEKLAGEDGFPFGYLELLAREALK